MPKNKYIIRSRISEAKFREIIKYFALDLSANQIAILTKISRPTINKILKKVREKIAEKCEEEAKFCGIVEADESYFGAKRVRGKRGRGAGGKIKVFGLMKRKDKVFTKIVEHCDRKTLFKIIENRVDFSSEMNTDGFKTYDGLVDLGFKKHHRVQHSKDEFTKGKAHINGIENFWGLAKVRFAKFRGIHKSTFYLHLKECEFRFNFRNENLYAKILERRSEEHTV